jgi:hypothetical protein
MPRTWAKELSNCRRRGAVFHGMTARGFVVVTACVAAGVAAGLSDYASAKQKMDAIESDRLPPGSRVAFTPAELNAYIQRDIAPEFPDGVRDLGLELAEGAATGSALIDFAKVRRAQGKPPGWLLGRVLEGEKQVKVRARVDSGGGTASVHVEDVEIAGMSISGPFLDYLVENYLLPNYPGAKLDQRFALEHRIDHLEIRPKGVAVLLSR